MPERFKVVCIYTMQGAIQVICFTFTTRLRIALCYIWCDLQFYFTY